MPGKADVRKRRGKKEPPLMTVDEGLYWAVALGQNSRGQVSEETKGVCEVWGVGRGFIARAGVQAGSSHIRKKARATAASKGSVSVPDWTRLQGVGLRRFSQPPELVCGIFPGHTSTCPTFHTGEQNSKPLQYSCLEKPINSMKRQKDTILKDHIQVGICPICYWR